MFNVFVSLCHYDSFRLLCYWGYVGRFSFTLEGVLSFQQWMKLNKDSTEHKKMIKNRGEVKFCAQVRA